MIENPKELDKALNAPVASQTAVLKENSPLILPGSMPRASDLASERLLEELTVPAKWLMAVLWSVSFALFVYSLIPSTAFIKLLDSTHHPDSSLVRTIQLLGSRVDGEDGMWFAQSVLSIFSVYVPPVMLTWILCLVVCPTSHHFRSSSMSWLSNLGRLTMLTIFFLLVVLTAGRGPEDGTVLPSKAEFPRAHFACGAVTYTVAVIASMAAVAVAANHIAQPATPADEDAQRVVHLARGGCFASAAVVLSMTGVVLILYSFFAPMYSLNGDAWSVLRALEVLGSPRFIGFLALFVLVVPIALFVTVLALYIVPRPLTSQDGVTKRTAGVVSTFCLLDVLWLSAVLYACTPHAITVDLTTGWWCMSAYVIVHPLALVFSRLAETNIEEAIEADDILATA